MLVLVLVDVLVDETSQPVPLEHQVVGVRSENDRRVIDAMLALEPERVITEALASQNACCAGAAATAIEAYPVRISETLRLLAERLDAECH